MLYRVKRVPDASADNGDEAVVALMQGASAFCTGVLIAARLVAIGPWFVAIVGAAAPVPLFCTQPCIVVFCADVSWSTGMPDAASN